MSFLPTEIQEMTNSVPITTLTFVIEKPCESIHETLLWNHKRNTKHATINKKLRLDEVSERLKKELETASLRNRVSGQSLAERTGCGKSPHFCATTRVRICDFFLLKLAQNVKTVLSRLSVSPF